MPQYRRFLSKIILMLKKIPVRAVCINPRYNSGISNVSLQLQDGNPSCSCFLFCLPVLRDMALSSARKIMQHKKAGREIKFPARFHEDRICNLLAAQIFYIFGSKNNGIQLAGVLLPVGLHEEQNNESDRHVCYQGHPTCEVQGQGGGNHHPHRNDHADKEEPVAKGGTVRTLPVGMELTQPIGIKADHEVHKASGNAGHRVNILHPVGRGEEAEEYGEKQNHNIGDIGLTVLIELHKSRRQHVQLSGAIEHTGRGGPEAHEGGKAVERTGNQSAPGEDHGQPQRTDQLRLRHLHLSQLIPGSHTANGNYHDGIQDGGDKQSCQDDLPHVLYGECSLLDHGRRHLKADELDGQHAGSQEQAITALGEPATVTQQVLGAPVTAGEKQDNNAERNAYHAIEENVAELTGNGDVEVGDDVPDDAHTDSNQHGLGGGELNKEAQSRRQNESADGGLHDLDQEHQPLHAPAELVVGGISYPAIIQGY